MRKQLTVMGEIWDFWTVLKAYDSAYDSIYISCYKPWLKGEIDPEKIVLANEASRSKFSWVWKLIRRTILIKKTVDDFKPDLLITHHDDANISVIPFLLLNKIFFRKNIKFIAYIHAGAETYNTKDGLTRLTTSIICFFYRFFDQVCTVSEGNKIDLEKRFGLKNIKVMYNPIDISLYRKKAEAKSKDIERIKKRGDFIFISLGRLTEQKGQWYLIRAFKSVVEAHHNAKLIIIGEGELREELTDLITRLRLEHHVFLVGMKENVFSLISRSDCFVLSTLWESFGQALLEALALDKPVICSDCKSGPREILCPEIGLSKRIRYPFKGSYGILSTPFKRRFVWKTLDEEHLSREESQLSSLMMEMISDKMLRRKYSSGSKRARDFDIKKIEGQIKDL
jgi:glycosyltransferase involved in cell wall biosynthesis